MVDWNNKGCESCRKLWEQGERPKFISESIKYHSRLYQCEVCGVFWEEYERFADIVDIEDVSSKYK